MSLHSNIERRIGIQRNLDRIQLREFRHGGSPEKQSHLTTTTTRSRAGNSQVARWTYLTTAVTSTAKASTCCVFVLPIFWILCFLSWFVFSSFWFISFASESGICGLPFCLDFTNFAIFFLVCCFPPLPVYFSPPPSFDLSAAWPISLSLSHLPSHPSAALCHISVF